VVLTAQGAMFRERTALLMSSMMFAILHLSPLVFVHLTRWAGCAARRGCAPAASGRASRSTSPTTRGCSRSAGSAAGPGYCGGGT